MRDLYTVLGIPRDADQAKIRKAFKKLARKFHPDLNKDPKAADRFKEINTAYEVLGDEGRRNAYDSFGEASLKPGFDPGQARQWREAAGGRGGGGFGGGGFGGGGFNIDELLKNFGGRSQAPRQRAAPTKGADIEQQLSVTLEQLIAGEGITVDIRRPSPCQGCSGEGGRGRTKCGACGGSGDKEVGPVTFPCVACSGAGHRFQDECSTCEGTGRAMKIEHLKVRVPPGVQDGQAIRLRGKGAEGKQRQRPGDLLLSVRIQKHSLFERDGSDLRLGVPLTIHEAMAGAQVRVPTLYGAIKVRVPENTDAGQQMRIKNRGLPTTGGKRGDLYLILNPSPPASTAKSLKLAEKLEALYEAPPRAAWDD